MPALRALPDIVRLARRLLADPRTPTRHRVGLVVLIVWLVSPIDLIPEFLPGIGPLDDIVAAAVILGWIGRRDRPCPVGGAVAGRCRGVRRRRPDAAAAGRVGWSAVAGGTDDGRPATARLGPRRARLASGVLAKPGFLWAPVVLTAILALPLAFLPGMDGYLSVLRDPGGCRGLLPAHSVPVLAASVLLGIVLGPLVTAVSFQLGRQYLDGEPPRPFAPGIVDLALKFFLLTVPSSCWRPEAPSCSPSPSSCSRASWASRRRS